jgi:hypothetical protein
LATIALPSDPNQLIDMLTLRMESYYTGNNGVRNETVSIAGVLKQSDVVNDEQQGFFLSHASAEAQGNVVRAICLSKVNPHF